MSPRRQILRRVAIRAGLAVLGGLGSWMGTSEFAGLVGDPVLAAAIGALAAPIVYDLRDALRQA